ncbi:HesB/YadR/YfhF family protein [Alicyclobacillus fodiniaquatilis]|uniref:HesB/YadR/YfhF family protein n=1 Tax=Alicyclobacillus fodiniaquatilis TaxID=1661150 RepID=A0ABW4JE83_9BACL
MDIIINDSAIQWLKEEFGLEQGDAVRIMTRYGDSTAHPGFALTLSVERPHDVAFAAKQDGIELFVKEQDAWYFDDHDLYVSYDKNNDHLSLDVK